MAFNSRAHPHQLTGIGVVGFHLADNTELTTGNAGDHFAFDNDRCGSNGITRLVVGDLLDPHGLAGVFVQSHEFGIESADNNLVVVQGNAAVNHITTGHDAVGQTRVVLPDLLAGSGINSVNTGIGGGHIHHAILDQWLRLLAAHFLAAKRERPGWLEVLNVAGVKVFQDTEALTLGTHAVTDNIARRFMIVHDVFVGDRLGPIRYRQRQGTGRNANPELVRCHGCALQVSCFRCYRFCFRMNRELFPPLK